MNLFFDIVDRCNLKCPRDISTGVRITDIKSTEELVSIRLKNEVRKKCSELRLYNYLYG